MTLGRVAAMMLVVVVAGAVLPDTLHAWTPATHIYLGQSVLENLTLLPTPVADLLRAFPFDFLYGNIAADSSIAKNYAPVSRHCHHWHVGQEIHDHAGSDALRAFGLGYLSHLSADAVAHNYFVPRQLALTSSTPSVGHAYWESRFEAHLGDGYAKQAKAVITMDHSQADGLLDQIISPTIFSVRTNRRLFRGMVHLTETQGWQTAFRVAREQSRWDLQNDHVEIHMAWSFDLIVDMLTEQNQMARELDPSGTESLRQSKELRRQYQRIGGRRNGRQLAEAVEDEFGLPTESLGHWDASTKVRPWQETVTSHGVVP
ncbi:MAG: zinc dependent phospholipase C family protein [Gemmatimonadales bacterium]